MISARRWSAKAIEGRRFCIHEYALCREARTHFETALAQAGDGVGRGEAEFGIAGSLRVVDDLVGAVPVTDLVVQRAMLLADAACGRLTLQTRAELEQLIETAGRMGLVGMAKVEIEMKAVVR